MFKEKLKFKATEISLPSLLLLIVTLIILLIYYSFNPMIEAYVIYSDGKPVAALKSENDATDVLASILLEYQTDNSEVSFDNNVKVEKALVARDEVLLRKDAERKLSGYREQAVVHTVKEGENLEDIAKLYNVTIKDIKDKNSFVFYDYMPSGTKLNINSKVKILDIKVVSYEEKNELIEYDTVVKNDDELYEGETEVSIEGVNGEKKTLYEVVELNGKEKTKKIVKENIIKKPVNKVLMIGTKEKGSTEPTGEFIIPYKGNMTSRFGRRWGRNHNGIDISGPVGSPIMASDGGEVTFAGWDNGGYGNLVIIKHNDGYETYYAHMNEITVSKGYRVSKGEKIGTVGNTGRSTGPHLHFEIRKDGVAKDPSAYTE